MSAPVFCEAVAGITRVEYRRDRYHANRLIDEPYLLLVYYQQVGHLSRELVYD